jgi:hypothetical protein
MTFLCVISGCLWIDGDTTRMGKETLLCQCCSRCGSYRYLPGTDASDH